MAQLPRAAASPSEDGALSEDTAERTELEEVLESYRVPAGADYDSSAEVFIVRKGSLGKYVVREPELTREEGSALSALKRSLLDVVPPEAKGSTGEVVRRHLRAAAESAGVEDVVAPAERKVMYYLAREFEGFWEIDPLMKDDRLEEISLTRFDKPVRLLHRDYTEFLFMETNVAFESEQRLQSFVRRLAQLGATTVSLAQPSLEVTLQRHSDARITATLGDEISRPGSTFAIRKQRAAPLTLAHLSAPEPPRGPSGWGREEWPSPPAYEEVPFHKTLSVLMAAYFWLLLERTTNVLVAGETNSGKTTLMNAILALADQRSKIVTAEDVLEINLPDHLHWERLRTRSYRAGLSPSAGRYEYGLSDLLKLALRFSPTILSLGEMRGEESETLAAAITLGFSTMTTIHAESAEMCVQRLTTPPMRFAEGHVRDITAIATMKRTVLDDGRIARRVVSVDEVRPVGAGGHEIVNVFRHDRQSDSFRPATPAEVVDRSFRLREIAGSFGWDQGRVQRSLASRAAYMARAVSGGEFTPSAMSRMVREHSAREFRDEAGRR